MNRRVDQKLHLARLALAAIDTNPSAETALLEAAVFHLYVAYRAYLRELVAHFNLALDVDNAHVAATLLQAQQLASADVDELEKMEQSGEWPTQLCAAYAAAVGVEITQAAVASTGIALHDVTAQIDATIVAAWIRQFSALLERQREHACEW